MDPSKYNFHRFNFEVAQSKPFRSLAFPVFRKDQNIPNPRSFRDEDPKELVVDELDYLSGAQFAPARMYVESESSAENRHLRLFLGHCFSEELSLDYQAGENRNFAGVARTLPSS